MGIKALTKLLKDNAKSCFKEGKMESYHGRKVAIDAYMLLYQFLIAVRQDAGYAFTNDGGEETMHLSGIFYRAIKFIDSGIKPIFVFDGKAPEMKSGELEKRSQIHKEAEEKLIEATKAGNVEEMTKFSKRVVKVSSKHTSDAKKLLKLMGVPYFEAPCEAESQCAYFQKKGLVYGVATEDMDVLTFGSGIMLRNLNQRESKKLPVVEISLEKALEELQISMESFIDLCILLGCDYCDSIGGIGPKRALDLIKKFGSIENVLEEISDTKKYTIPENWPYKEARMLFKNPLIDEIEPKFEWNAPNEEEIVEFMCKENSFQEDRIRNSIAKLLKATKKPTQLRIDSFFKPVNNNSSKISDKRPVKVKKTKQK